MREPRYRWWEKPDGFHRRRIYYKHLIHDCGMPPADALALAKHNFGDDRPDPIDQLLTQSNQP